MHIYYVAIQQYFKRQIGEIAHEETWTWQSRENLRRETKSLLIAAKIIPQGLIISNAKIDNAQENTSFSYVETEEKKQRWNIISEYSVTGTQR